MKRAPYIASEDSALLRKAIEARSGRACLEIGAGNGGTLVKLSKNFELSVGSDIVRPDMEDWSGAGADYVLSDLATCFRDGTFDTVLFNPPYLPSEGIEDPAVDAGRDDEVPLAFLREALRVVKGSGSVIMLLSRENLPDKFRWECEQKGFSLAQIEGRHLFFEEISVYEASMSDLAHPCGAAISGNPAV